MDAATFTQFDPAPKSEDDVVATRIPDYFL